MSSSKSIKTRICLGTLMILLLGVVFGIDIYFYHIFKTDTDFAKLFVSRGVVIRIVVIIISVLLSLELLNFARATGAAPFTFLTVLGSAIASFPYLYSFFYRLMHYDIVIDKLVILCTLLILLFISQIARGDTIRAGANIAWSIFIVIYAGLLLSYISVVRYWFGPYALIIMLSAVKGADIGAYFTGTALGKHKLIPWLSPGKSIEGLIGAIVFGALITYGLVWILPRDDTILKLYNLGAIKLLFIGALLAVVGQFGDLSESLLKRDADIKDSAHLIPEFGGFCDLLDSVLPAGFIWYWVLKLILQMG